MTPQLILGIDPGPTTSGVVLYDPVQRVVLWSTAKMGTGAMLDAFREGFFRDWEKPNENVWYMDDMTLAVERVVSYGKRIGAETIQTIEVIGRLLEMWEGRTAYAISRPDVLDAIAGNRSCKEGPAWDRLCEMHGGDKTQAVGTKKSPGPLYGVGSHARSALAVAVVAAMRAKLEEQKGEA